MRTKEDIIKDLERTISMAENKFSTCVKYNLDPDEFNAWMFGYMLGTIERAITDLQLL